jgi:hypothetical protein
MIGQKVTPEEMLNIGFLDKLKGEIRHDDYIEISVVVQVRNKHSRRYHGDTERTNFVLDPNGLFKKGQTNE